jgi:nitroreductase
VVQGRERLQRLGVEALEYARIHGAAPGRAWEWAHRPGFQVFWGAPALVLICAEAGHAEAPFDCHRAGQNLTLAAHARGLGSCWVGSPLPWLRSKGVAERVGIAARYEPCVAIVLGYADESPVGKPRARPAITWSDAD